MTQAEFWQAEAESEGKGREPWELRAEFLQEIEGERVADEQRLKDDPAECWRMINDMAQADLKAWEENAACNGERYPERRWVDGQSVESLSEPYDAGPRPHVPTSLVEVLEVQMSSGLSRESSLSVKARVACDDGQERTVTYQAWHSSGSFYEPPDSDESLSWDDGTGAEVIP